MKATKLTGERIKEYLSEGKRFDGRSPESFRDIVIEKDVSIGLSKGALVSEIRDAMYGNENSTPKIISFIAGLGGRDIGIYSIENVIKTCENALESEVDDVCWVDLNVEQLP